MQAPFDNIVQHLFHQPSLHSVTVDELEKMAIRHPYFAAAHFLLLKKMQDTAHPKFTAQLHKAAIYFNNPLWLQFLLQPETVSNFSVSEQSPFITSDSIAQPSLSEENGNGHQYEPVAEKNEAEQPSPFAETGPEHTGIITPEDAAGAEQSLAHVEQDTFDNVITEIYSNPGPLYNTYLPETTSTETPEDISAQATESPTEQAEEVSQKIHEPEPNQSFFVENILAPEPAIAHAGQSITHTDTEIYTPFVQEEPVIAPGESQPEMVAETASEVQHAEHLVEATTETIIPEATDHAGGNFITETPVTSFNPEQPLEHNTITDIEDAADADATDHAGGNFIAETSATSFIAEQPVEHNTITDIEDAADADATDPITETTTDYNPAAATQPNQEETNFIKIIETPAAKNDLLFEPYHTVDYFASQGIKLGKMDIDPKDKLGRQLKSFTEWLKTMKKLPQTSIDKLLAQNEESKVVADANHSIENKEVITEAMAEVFEKQGLREKAVDVYEKLSLQNPAKSAYFAARIEALKH